MLKIFLLGKSATCAIFWCQQMPPAYISIICSSSSCTSRHDIVFLLLRDILYQHRPVVLVLFWRLVPCNGQCPAKTHQVVGVRRRHVNGGRWFKCPSIRRLKQSREKTLCAENGSVFIRGSDINLKVRVRVRNIVVIR